MTVIMVIFDTSWMLLLAVLFVSD